MYRTVNIVNNSFNIPENTLRAIFGGTVAHKSSLVPEIAPLNILNYRPRHKNYRSYISTTFARHRSLFRSQRTLCCFPNRDIQRLGLYTETVICSVDLTTSPRELRTFHDTFWNWLGAGNFFPLLTCLWFVWKTTGSFLTGPPRRSCRSTRSSRRGPKLPAWGRASDLQGKFPFK